MELNLDYAESRYANGKALGVSKAGCTTVNALNAIRRVREIRRKSTPCFPGSLHHRNS